ncbi:hypothetical protein [Cellulomonas bogoriensis]|uniref:Uncharacterized protein n=1 Tax=Cellulomonas bogoriensis 69B4 = DSM 16987 TaxID=1386082 RepID=A0A0A0C420_9CELL|nr:hypothetical protein [Cellulomonas bogoriensis]KGM14124.1 hypothetical protein N869_03905 [Cellulomonas bogoriensis 69B4 = DSM 16987]
MPPLLSSRRLFWVGIAFAFVPPLLNVLLSVLLSGALTGTGWATMRVLSTVTAFVGTILQPFALIGAGLVAASFVVRHVEAARTSPEP